MANTLSSVLPVIYEAADVVSRELTGFIPASFRNSTAERAAKDQTVTYPIVPTMAAADIAPGATSSTGTDMTVGSGSMTISKSRKVSFNWTGEEQTALSNGDRPQLTNILRDQFAQAMRTLCNEIEADLWAAAYKGSSRAYGTAATAPFGTAGDLSDFAGVRQILDDNGAPQTDLHLVLGSAAMANLRGKQSVLFKVNEAGTSDFLRRGVIGDVMGLMLHNSYPVTVHTKGGGSAYALNLVAGYSVGSTTFAVDTGSGTILAGDILTNSQSGRDANKYVVNTALAGGSLAIGAPGNRVAWVDNDTVAVGNSYTPNVAFHRNALHLITRSPAMPAGGDSAVDVTEVVDPTSGLAFQVALYRQYRQISYEVGMAWGVKAVKPAHIATLIG
jgi:hypothetical protein